MPRDATSEERAARHGEERAARHGEERAARHEFPRDARLAGNERPAACV